MYLIDDAFFNVLTMLILMQIFKIIHAQDYVLMELLLRITLRNVCRNVQMSLLTHMLIILAEDAWRYVQVEAMECPITYLVLNFVGGHILQIQLIIHV